MRIKEPFANDRKSETINYNAKYFIISEGQKTEPRYFEKLNKSVISENVTIVNILRDYANLGNSNPTYLVELLKELLNTGNNEISVSELKNKIANWNHENPNKINKEEVFNKINNIYKSNKSRINYEEIELLFIELFKSDVYKDLATNFSLYFKTQDIMYSPITDTINLVIDRDKNSFTEDQYDEVVKFCNINKVNLYVSNPCFEFWLYLHFKEVENEDKVKLLENPKVKGKKRYIEKKLHDICKYTKNKFSFEPFENKLYDAILREKNYAEDIFELKCNLGSNIGKLVEKIVNYQKK